MSEGGKVGRFVLLGLFVGVGNSVRKEKGPTASLL